MVSEIVTKSQECTEHGGKVPGCTLLRWARSYDLLSVFDLEVAKLLEQLKEDELYENTIIFVLSEHGTGLPGYKRWLNNDGLQLQNLH